MGTLYVVATPIGNLEDVTLRALRVLREVGVVLAEDTRRTRNLLTRHGIEAVPRALHAHNEASRTREVLRTLETGGSAALVSDAGTPLISDPGERLVAAAVAEGHSVVSVPGASAVTAALAVAGLPTLPFTCLGFLPRRSGARRALLESYAGRPETLVIFEAKQRVARTLRELASALGDRRVCAARELTKAHEELARGSLTELAERFGAGARGEFTLVVEGAAHAQPLIRDSDVEAAILEHVRAGLGPRDIAALLAKPTGLGRRDLYARALAAREPR